MRFVTSNFRPPSFFAWDVLASTRGGFWSSCASRSSSCLPFWFCFVLLFGDDFKWEGSDEQRHSERFLRWFPPFCIPNFFLSSAKPVFQRSHSVLPCVFAAIHLKPSRFFSAFPAGHEYRTPENQNRSFFLCCQWPAGCFPRNLFIEQKALEKCDKAMLAIYLSEPIFHVHHFYFNDCYYLDYEILSRVNL